MFYLEEKISEWRQQMLAAGFTTPVQLDELESHLREDIRAFLAAGKPEAQAFQLAVSRLGSPSSLQAEFHKIKIAPCLPVTLGSWLWLGATVLLAAALTGRLLDGKLSLLLFAHILSLTAGYGAAFVAGGFGMCYVWWRWSNTLSPGRRQSLDRAVIRFCQLSAGLVFAGTVLGLIWHRQNRGGYWEGDPREIGTFCVWAWLGAFWLIRQLGEIGERATMLMSIGGNVVVSLAWFGAGILASVASSPLTHSSGGAIYWPLAAFLGVHLCFLAMGLAPASQEIES